MASLSPLRSKNAHGMVAGLSAFLIWGLLPLYWHAMTGMALLELLAHRIFWSLVTIAPFVWWTGRLPEVRTALSQGRVMLRIAASALLIGINWCLYIWAVTHDRVIEASLGYYINPLVNVLLGRVLLGERLTRIQSLAVGIASLGVMWSVAAYGHFPWLALTLALTFALYGFCRKTVPVESAPGLFLETLLLFPLAVAWLWWLHSHGQEQGLFFVLPVQARVLLALSGLVTSVPLLLFAYAARNMPLSTLGLLQYVSPTSTFLLGVFAFHEPVTQASLVTFACIWTALAIYSWSSLRRMRGLAA